MKDRPPCLELVACSRSDSGDAATLLTLRTWINTARRRATVGDETGREDRRARRKLVLLETSTTLVFALPLLLPLPLLLLVLLPLLLLVLVEVEGDAAVGCCERDL